MYNIGQDTRFEPGGDDGLSYIYQLGYQTPPGWFDGRGATDAAPPWAARLMNEAHELFDLISLKVDAVLEELKRK